ncbi:hypothetical protein FGO68_gene11258 [Halteria grandinella]|uniref:Hydroxysteroid dehydrogenase-like protein 2 n=1 Tax=Halteria grandinella TaxID=5974 RepID=A0A8J8NM96_HALGN|nr:hypothetical protein FGO68_gene11258 [Halteria grandinella]
MKNFEPYEFKKAGDLKGKTLFITGASRGIGLAIALRAAKDGANIAIAAKTAEAHPKLEGTIHTAAEEIRKAGGRCLPIQCDIRDEKSVRDAVELTVKTFGGIDILVNNASALYMAKAEETSMKQYDLAMSINARGTFLVSKYCIPHLRNSKNPRILTISPPLYAATDPRVNWYARIGVGYTIAKLGMTLITHGLSEELGGDGVGCNTLWPRTMIATAAVQNLLGGDESMRKSRTPDIMGDAAYEIVTSDSRKTNDQSFFDDEVLLSVYGQGLDLSKYRIVKDAKETELVTDFIC